MLFLCVFSVSKHISITQPVSVCMFIFDRQNASTMKSWKWDSSFTSHNQSLNLARINVTFHQLTYTGPKRQICSLSITNSLQNNTKAKWSRYSNTTSAKSTQKCWIISLINGWSKQSSEILLPSHRRHLGVFASTANPHIMNSTFSLFLMAYVRTYHARFKEVGNKHF